MRVRHKRVRMTIIRVWAALNRDAREWLIWADSAWNLVEIHGSAVRVWRHMIHEKSAPSAVFKKTVPDDMYQERISHMVAEGGQSITFFEI